MRAEKRSALFRSIIPLPPPLVNRFSKKILTYFFAKIFQKNISRHMPFCTNRKTPQYTTLYGFFLCQKIQKNDFFDFFDNKKSSFLIIYKRNFLRYNIAIRTATTDAAEYQAYDINAPIGLDPCFFTAYLIVIVNKFQKVWNLM